MAAGGFKEFIAGEVLDEDAINDYLLQGVLVFAGTAARGSAITSPVEGQFSFLADSDSVEFWDGSAWVQLESGPVLFDYLVVGGGAGGGRAGGGGGAGGYRNSVTGETSGGTAVAEQQAAFAPGVSFTVTVGAGSAGSTTLVRGANGGESRLGSIRAVGGGAAGVGQSASRSGLAGASGGGGSGVGGTSTVAPGGLFLLGFPGGTGTTDGGTFTSTGGGGGAGAAGANGPGGAGVANGAGGAGLSSSITGSSVPRGGGGGGGGEALTSGAGGAGGTGGGGAGSSVSGGTGTAGTVNTGGGGGGGNLSAVGSGGNGGSGIVIIKYPDNITLTIGGGLTSSTTSAGGFKVTSFTAGTDTVSF